MGHLFVPVDKARAESNREKCGYLPTQRELKIYLRALFFVDHAQRIANASRAF